MHIRLAIKNDIDQLIRILFRMSVISSGGFMRRSLVHLDC